MITDFQNTLSAAQVVTATAFSTNAIDLSQSRDIGAGEELNIYVNCDLTALAAGAATVNFQIVTSANANLSTPTIIGQSDAIGKASIVTGFQIILPVPRSVINALGQRYLGIQYTITTGPLTQGTFSAGVVFDGADNTGLVKKVYPSGFAVK